MNFQQHCGPYLIDISNQKLSQLPNFDQSRELHDLVVQNSHSQNSLNKNQKSMNLKNQLLCIISIEVKQNQLDDIEIYQDSDPVGLAYHFCKKNFIPERVMFKLMKHIDESKQQAVEKLHKFTRQNDPYTFGNKLKFQGQQIENFPQEFISPIFEDNRLFVSEDDINEKFNTLLLESDTQKIDSEANNPQLIDRVAPMDIFRRNSYHPDTENMTFTPRINKASQHIFQQNLNSGRCVFERLYSHAKVQKYSKNKQMEIQVNANLFKESDKKGDILSSRQHNKSYDFTQIEQTIESRMSRYAFEKNENIKVLRDKVEEEEIIKCSFKPQINNKTQEILKRTASQSRSPARHTQERYLKRQSVNTLVTDCQSQHFQPRINKRSVDQVNGQSFENRQCRFLLDKEQKLNQLIEIKDAKDYCDFKPQILTNRQSSQLDFVHKDPVWMNLYQENHRRQVQQQCKVAELKQQIRCQRPKINSHSEKLLKGSAQKIIQQIFHKLDSNEDGCISQDKIDLRSISPIILQIISCILFEMEEKNETLSCEQFLHKIFSNRDQYLWRKLVDNKSLL